MSTIFGLNVFKTTQLTNQDVFKDVCVCGFTVKICFMSTSLGLPPPPPSQKTTGASNKASIILSRYQLRSNSFGNLVLINFHVHS